MHEAEILKELPVHTRAKLVCHVLRDVFQNSYIFKVRHCTCMVQTPTLDLHTRLLQKKIAPSCHMRPRTVCHLSCSYDNAIA